MAAKHLKRWIWQQAGWPAFTWDPAILSAPVALARRTQGEVAGVAKLLDAHTDLNAHCGCSPGN